jgi:hypothetical protein
VLNQPAAAEVSPFSAPAPVMPTMDTLTPFSSPAAAPVEFTPTGTSSAPLIDNMLSTPPVSSNEPVTSPAPSSAPTPSDEASTPAPSSDDLLSMKQRALAQLSPLVGQLDQTPEEKFRTTMMMIQSTDDPTMLKDAYTAAQTIQDEKARAQALLDVVNEINYFTQHS